jgi:hypothetical protein
MCLFSRLRVRVGGQQVEDVLWLNRLVGMLMKLLPANRNWSQSIEGLGGAESGPFGQGSGPTAESIAANGSRHVITPIHGSGLFATHYLLPVGSFPLEIELELCDPVQVATYGNGSNASQQYQLTQCRLLYDTVSVDSAIQNQIAQSLLEGKPLPLHFKSWSNCYYTINSAGGSWSISSTRGFSRLASVFVTFSCQARSYQATALTMCNSFQSWHGTGNYNFASDSFRAQLQIGSSLWPDRPLESHAECFYQLSKTLAMHSSLDGVSIIPNQYKWDNFIIALDLEKAIFSRRAAAWPPSPA